MEEVPRAWIGLDLDTEFWADRDQLPWVEFCKPCVTAANYPTYPRPPLLTEDGGQLPVDVEFAVGPRATVRLDAGERYVVPDDCDLVDVWASGEVSLSVNNIRIAGPEFAEPGRLVVHERKLQSGDLIAFPDEHEGAFASLVLGNFRSG